MINAFGPKLERNILKIKADLAVTQLNDYLRFIKNNNSFGVLETKGMKKKLKCTQKTFFIELLYQYKTWEGCIVLYS